MKQARKRRSLSYSNYESHRIYPSKKFTLGVESDLFRSKRSVLIERFIETFVVADHLLFKEFRARNRDLELYILSIFNMVGYSIRLTFISVC